MKTLAELRSLNGRVALITGGAGMIALAFGEVLGELGADVALFDIAADAAADRARDLQQRYGHRCSAWTLDIADEAAVQKAVREVVNKFGRLDILINNAAYTPSDLPEDGLPLTEQTLPQWDHMLRTVLTGAFLMSRACAPSLAEHGCGSIVNVASIYGLVGPDLGLYDGTQMTNSANYAAAKGGLAQLTRYLATTLAPKVRVNCIAPGGVWRNQPASFHERYKARTPLGRMATEEDLKGALAFLAGDLSAYVTGQVLAVDGGWTAW